MSTLTITIEEQTTQDYDGVDETVKIASGDIDGVNLHEKITCESTVSDADVKIAYKALLTDHGHTWDDEA